MLNCLRIFFDVKQRFAALKLRLIKRDHVPQSAVGHFTAGGATVSLDPTIQYSLIGITLTVFYACLLYKIFYYLENV